jgi:hypothetical protein
MGGVSFLGYGWPMDACRKNTLGQEVALSSNREMDPGYHEVELQANVASGICFYRIDAVSVNDPNNRFVQVKKMVLLR